MTIFRLFAALILAVAVSFATAASPTEQDLAYGPLPAQRLDLYRPATPGPLIVMVHGGAWRFGDKTAGRVVDAKVARWVPRGIAVASINYRMLPAAAPLDQARDVARALAWLQQNSAKFPVDRSEIVLMGHSAGAHLIALLAARPDLLAEAGAAPVRGFLLLDSGAFDVPAIMQARHFRFYDEAFGSDPADWAAVSPQQQLRAATAPILAVCSSRRIESCPPAQRFAARARQFGAVAEVLALDKTHGEINADLGNDPAYTAMVENFLGRLSAAFAERLRP